MRLGKIDILRGIAIILMVIFHINYSLVNIFDNNILNFSKDFWFYEGRISALLFIFIGGFSFYLSEKKYGNEILKKYFKYSITLGVIALLISMTTYLFFREQYIRFGIIHFFSLSFILIIFFRKFRLYNIIIGLLIIIYGFYFIAIIENKYLYFLGFTYNGFYSSDFYPILPYFGVMLLGYSLALFLNKKNKLNIFKLKKINFINKILVYLGKKSLIIYLIHQPIIIFCIYLIQSIY